MKSLILIAALAAAAPMIALPSTADAQVLTGRGRSTSSPPRRRTPPPAPRPALSVDEEVELFDAQGEIAAIDARLAEYQRLDQEGALSEDARAYWQADHERRDELQARVDVLTAKRDGL